MSNASKAQINNYDSAGVAIKVFRDSFDFGESILIKIDITNIGSKEQKITLDTGMFSCVSIQLQDRKTKKSVVKNMEAKPQ